MKSKPIKTVAVVALLTIPVQVRLGAQNQPPQNQARSGFTQATASYNFLIASGFLCDNADGCPAMVQAGNGETIAVSGAGRIELAEKSVTGAGAYYQKTPAGTVAGTGAWMATALVSFEAYGIAQFALLRDYPELRTVGMLSLGRSMMPGRMMAGPMGTLMKGPLIAGGLAVIRIRLLPDSGMPQDAVLRVNCAQGKVPEDAQTDGVRLAITGGTSFDVPVTGRTVFVLQRPMPNSAVKNFQRQQR